MEYGSFLARGIKATGGKIGEDIMVSMSRARAHHVLRLRDPRGTSRLKRKALECKGSRAKWWYWSAQTSAKRAV